MEHGRGHVPLRMEIQMTDPDAPLTPEMLKRNRKHFGDVPYYFEVQFEGEAEPSLLSVDEVWRAHAEGRKPIHFKGTDLISKQQQAFLTALADMIGSGA